MIDYAKLNLDAPQTLDVPETFPRKSWYCVPIAGGPYPLRRRHVQIATAALLASQAIEAGEHVDARGMMLAMAGKALEVFRCGKWLQSSRMEIVSETYADYCRTRDAAIERAIDIALKAQLDNVDPVTATDELLWQTCRAAIDFDYLRSREDPEFPCLHSIPFDMEVLEGYGIADQRFANPNGHLLPAMPRSRAQHLFAFYDANASSFGYTTSAEAAPTGPAASASAKACSCTVCASAAPSRPAVPSPTSLFKFQ